MKCTLQNYEHVKEVKWLPTHKLKEESTLMKVYSFETLLMSFMLYCLFI